MIENIQEKDKGFSKLTRQHILYRCAKASMDELGRGFLYIYEITMILKSRTGIEPLKEVWKNKTEENLRKLDQIGAIASQINFFLFDVDDLRFKKEIDVMDKRFLNARKYYALLVSNMDLIYEAFYILLDATPSIKNLDIPNEYFSELRKAIPKIEYETSS